MALTRSALWRSATGLIPGGVNSPVRAMRAVGLSEPVFMQRGEGAWIEDVSGNRYVDWVQSWGPLIFGHADPEIVNLEAELLNRVIVVPLTHERARLGASQAVTDLAEDPYERSLITARTALK